ncbi:MAG: hypothetical protein ABI638_06505 [Ignavibacteriota bacterium]
MFIDINKNDFTVGEITYHDSHPSWTYDDNEFYYPNGVLGRSYNMSGFITRAGIRFFY